MKVKLRIVIFIICALLMLSFITYSSQLKISIYNSVLICVKSLIPNLLPILCITLILSNSGLLSIIPSAFSGAFIFVLSMISGYPSGAKLLNVAVESNILKVKSAQKLLPSLVCAGPAFIINFVGGSIFGSQSIGIRLYICLVLSNLILFLMSGGYLLKISRYNTTFKFSRAIAKSVRQSTDIVISICAYVIIISAATEVVKLTFGEIVSKYFTYIFEVTKASVISNNIYTTCCILAWGGISVFMQILDSAEKIEVKPLKYITTRLFSSILSTLLLYISFKLFPATEQVISNISKPVKLLTYNTVPFLFVLMFTAFVFLYSLSVRSTGKFFKDILN